MKIRFISDLHYYLNSEYEAAELLNILSKKEPTDVTLIAGDASAEIEEMQKLLETYFKDEKVVFVNGNHCLTEDTEVLTETGWKNITTITCNDKVYQYNNGYAELVLPERIISNVVSTVYEFSSAYFYQCVTDQHRMVLSNGKISLAKDLIDKSLFQKDFVLTCNTKTEEDYPISDDLLKLLVWVVTDGTIVLYDKTLQKYTQKELEEYKQKPTKTRIQFHLSKVRKLEALQALLKKLNCEYTFKECKKEPLQTLQPYYIRIYSNFARKLVKLLEYSKSFPTWFLKLSKRQIKIVLDTLAITDGKYYTHPKTKECLSYHIIWGHTSKKDLDILQSCCIRHGFIFRYQQKAKKPYYFGNIVCKSTKNIYFCDIYTQSFNANTKQSKIEIIKKEGTFKVWCLTVPSGAFLIRCHGKTSITGNCIYNRSGKFVQDQIKEYKKRFNGQWKFLENDYVWLNDDIAVIGCIGWTDYKYHSYKDYHYMYDKEGRRLDQNGNLLPLDPRDTPEFKEKVKIILDKKEKYSVLDKELKELYRSVSPDSNERVDTSFKNRVSPEVYKAYTDWQESLNNQGKYEFSQEDYTRHNKRIAAQCMNDFNYGKVFDSDPLFGGFRYMNPDDCEKWHKQSKRYIKKAYNEIITKNPNAIVILMTHHPFTKKCEHEIYKGKELNAAFISNCDSWLKQFKNIKYYHCGHVHSRFFDKIGHINLICNPMGYLWYNEHKYNKPFDINCMVNIKTR